MKKTLIALAAVAASSAALAQSSVTLFGIVDVNVRNVSQGGQNLTSMSTDGTASSRIGFRGVEDLGGGMSASFWLEGALAPDTGNATGLTFQRRSTVSLSGGFGEVRLGRDYTPTFWNHTVYDPFGTNGVGSSLNTFSAVGSGSGTNVRADNALSYFTPNVAGFQGQIQYAFREATTNVANRYGGVRVTYTAGPLSAAVATASEGGASALNRFKRTNFGASYDFGFVKPMVQYTIGKWEDNTAVDREVKHFLIGATAPLGPGLIKASYVRSNYDNFQTNADASQFAVGYEYGLSKRTAVYANYSRISNDTGSTFGLAPNAGAVPSGGSSRGVEVGVRHSF